MSEYIRVRELLVRDLGAAWDNIPDGGQVPIGVGPWLQPLINATTAIIDDAYVGGVLPGKSLVEKKFKPSRYPGCTLCGLPRAETKYVVANPQTGNSVCETCVSRAAALLSGVHRGVGSCSLVVKPDAMDEGEHAVRLQRFRNLAAEAGERHDGQRVDMLAAECMAELGVEL
jgi:hypothetical protein